MGIDQAGVAWWAWRMAGPVPLVGREGELSRLVGALGGDAPMVLVTRDAGVGKARLVAEGMARAAAEPQPSAGRTTILEVRGPRPHDWWVIELQVASRRCADERLASCREQALLVARRSS